MIFAAGQSGRAVSFGMEADVFHSIAVHAFHEMLRRQSFQHLLAIAVLEGRTAKPGMDMFSSRHGRHPLMQPYLPPDRGVATVRSRDQPCRELFIERGSRSRVIGGSARAHAFDRGRWLYVSVYRVFLRASDVRGLRTVASAAGRRPAVLLGDDSRALLGPTAYRKLSALSELSLSAPTRDMMGTVRNPLTPHSFLLGRSKVLRYRLCRRTQH